MSAYDLGDTIREAMAADGRTQQQLARASGIDPGMLSRFRRQQRTLSLAALNRLVVALGLELVPKRARGGRRRA